ncbi:MAG: hypothetical protein NC548_51565 [Lachnospiraceae bacterium]|nr:hypothetical protein [Lachnospiraceae bacterium]
MFYIGLLGVVNLISSIIFIGSGILLLQDNKKVKLSAVIVSALFFVIAVIVAFVGAICFIAIKNI